MIPMKASQGLIFLSVVALLLLTSSVANDVQGQSKTRTQLDLGLKKDPNQQVGGSIEDALPNIVRVGETVTVYGKISILDTTGAKLIAGVVGATVNLLDISPQKEEQNLLATATTGENGYFVMEWKIDAKAISEEFAEQVKEGRTALEELTVIAKYGGDSTYMQSESLSYSVKVEPSRFSAIIKSDKQLYNAGEVAKVTITLSDVLDRKPVDLDSITVTFDGVDIPLTKDDVGVYSFSTPALSENIHVLNILAKKEGYVTELKTSTITVSAIVDLPVSVTAGLDQASYGVGDFIEITGSVDPVQANRPVLLQITNPNDTLYTVAQISASGDGTFRYEFKVAGPLAVAGKWNVKVTYMGQQTVQEFDVGEARTKFLIINIESARGVDEAGDGTTKRMVGEPFGVQARLTNEENKNIKLTYIVKINDNDGNTVSVSWLEINNLKAGGTIKPTIFWVPKEPGAYLAEIFVWDSLDIPTPFSGTESVKVRVT